MKISAFRLRNATLIGLATIVLILTALSYSPGWLSSRRQLTDYEMLPGMCACVRG